MRIESADHEFVFFETGTAEHRRGFYFKEDGVRVIGPYRKDEDAILACDIYTDGGEVPEPNA